MAVALELTGYLEQSSYFNTVDVFYSLENGGMKSSQHFREQLGVMSAWFERWNACEQTVALCSLLQRLAPTHARLLSGVLQQYSSATQLQPLEDEANDPAWVNHLSNESKEVAVSGLLSHLPLLRPGNLEAKTQYLTLIPKILAHSIRHGVHIEESRQLLSYSLIHPAVTGEDRLALTGWLRQLEDRIHNVNGFVHEKLPECNNVGLDLWRPGLGHSLPPGIGSQHMYTINHAMLSTHPDGTQTLPIVSHHTNSYQLHAPLSPQSSATSSGSESQFCQEVAPNAMRDVPSWLKGLRLHKYSYIFKNMSYEEMMDMTEEKLEKMNITKGARHKIVLSIQKLRDRQSSLQCLEKDLEEGEGNIRAALTEIRSVLSTPLQRLDETTDSGSDDSNPPSPPDSHLPVINDLPGQITRLLGKICSSLLIAINQDENLNFFVMIIDKCLSHEAFSPLQKRRLFSWKQQVQKASHPLPPRRSLHRASSSNSTATSKWEQATVQQDRRRLRVQPQKSNFPLSSSVIKRPSLQDHNNKPHVQIQRTNSAPVRPQPSSIFDGTDANEINIRLESLCLSVTEHALGSFDGAMPLF